MNIKVTRRIVNGNEVWEFENATPETMSNFLDRLLDDSEKQSVKRVKVDSPEYYLNLLCEKLNMNKAAFEHVVKCLNQVSAGALQSLFLSVIAREFDLCYPDHISKAESVVVFSHTDGKLHELMQSDIINKKAYKYFAAFRNQKDAIKALNIMTNMKNIVLHQ